MKKLFLIILVLATIALAGCFGGTTTDGDGTLPTNPAPGVSIDALQNQLSTVEGKVNFLNASDFQGQIDTIKQTLANFSVPSGSGVSQSDIDSAVQALRTDVFQQLSQLDSAITALANASNNDAELSVSPVINGLSMVLGLEVVNNTGDDLVGCFKIVFSPTAPIPLVGVSVNDALKDAFNTHGELLNVAQAKIPQFNVAWDGSQWVITGIIWHTITANIPTGTTSWSINFTGVSIPIGYWTASVYPIAVNASGGGAWGA